MVYKPKNKLINKVLISTSIAMSLVLPAAADDIDVYSALYAGQNKPNVLFVLDYSGSMRWDVEDNEIDDDDDDDTQSKASARYTNGDLQGLNGQ